MEEKEEGKKKKKKKYRALRIFGKIMLGLFIFIFLLLLFIRSPWGQSIIKDELVSYVSDQTGTAVEVDRLFITFSGNIYLDGLYLEDEQGDTLVYSKELEADIPLWPIIQGDGIAVNSLDWNGVRANITRQDTIQGYNFGFFAEAFAASDTTATAQDTTAQDTTAGQQFSIGDVNLSDFNVVYNDAVLGIESHYIVETLEVEMEDMDLENMKFSASQAYLANARIDYNQHPFTPDPNAEDVPLPIFIIENLELENVVANYESLPDGILAEMEINDLLLRLPEGNLQDNILNVERLDLNNSDISINMDTSEAESDEQATEAEASEAFQWPEWDIIVDEINFDKNNITYTTNNAQPEEGTFSANAVNVQDLQLAAQDVFMRNESMGANVENLSFRETSGINLQRLQFDAHFNDSGLSVEGLIMELNQNRLEGAIAANYNSVDSFLENPENSRLNAELQQFNIDVDDLFLIQPELENNEYLKTLSRRNLRGRISAQGTLAQIDITVANINWGSTTSVVASGSISNPTEPENMGFDFPRIKVNSTREDLRYFLNEEDLGITLPQQIALTASVQGNPEDIDANAYLNTSQGQIALDGSFSSSEGIAFNADMEVTDLALGEIMNNEQIGELNLSLTASGQGENINSLDASLDANISSFSYNDYPIRDLGLTGELEDGSGLVTMDYEDDNINMDMESYVVLDTVAPLVNLNLNMDGANLQALGLAAKDIRVAFELDGSFRGNLENFDLNAEILDGVAVHDESSYLLGDFELSGRVRPDSTALDIRNQIVDLNLRSNTDPTSFGQALKRHYQSYFEEDIYADTIPEPVNLEVRAQIRENPLITEVFFTSLEELDTVRIDVDFHERQRSLTANVDAPHVNYLGNEIDSLGLSVNSTRNDFDFILGFRSLDAGPLAIKETNLSGEIIDNEMHVDFNSYYEEETLLSIHSEIAQRNDSLYLHIDPTELILNGKDWNIPAANQILIADNLMEFTDFMLTRNNQRLEASNTPEDDISISFNEFRLASFLSYLNPEQPLADGRMNGAFTIEEPYGSTGFLAGIEVIDFNVLEVPLGNMTVDAEAVGLENYSFDLAIKEGDVDLDLTGGFNSDEEGTQWDTELEINEVRMAVVEGFSQGAITGASGSFSGNFELSETTADPEYSGDLNFDNATFTVATLDAEFSLPNESLSLDNEGISMESFTIEDQENNSFVLNGEVLTEDFLNPGFDLNFEAEHFTLLNATEEDNELYYGTAVVDASGHLGGDLNLPIIDLELNVDSDTDFTYVIPPSEIGIEERDGVVMFVNKENPDAILTDAEEESFSVTGIQINSVISIDDGAAFNVIVNENTGDNLRIQGEGDLTFNIYDNGRTTLSGRYTMSGGHYEMSLYGLVNRRFEIVDGSSITWAGDPFNADLDVTARYRVETSASALMAAQTSSADTPVRDRFRQELPFLVYLNIDGELASPILTFGLDMPEDEQGAIGGQVYSRVQQVNQQDQELNQQVFSLLVLNRFYPQSGTDGSSGGTMAIARDNLNNALSDQLNLVSNNLLGNSGIELDFGLDSFTDYQGATPQERTQLDIAAESTFLNERLVVRVGSEVDIQGSNQNQEPGESTPLIGNVSIEYLLNESGRFRVRGFRRNEYENVIDGQVIVNGLALIFTREFNKFRELFGKTEEEE